MKTTKKILTSLILFLTIWGGIHLTILLIDGLNDNPQQADAILIFGNKVELSGIPSQRLKSRLDKGIELYNDKLSPLIIVSGGLGKEGFEEATIMKEYLIAKKIPETSIIEDLNGYTTQQTAQNIKPLAPKIKSIIIVSQYYHITRAKLALHKVGYPTVYSAHANMAPELRDLYSIPREIVGYYSYLFRNYNYSK